MTALPCETTLGKIKSASKIQETDSPDKEKIKSQYCLRPRRQLNSNNGDKKKKKKSDHKAEKKSKTPKIIKSQQKKSHKLQKIESCLTKKTKSMINSQMFLLSESELELFSDDVLVENQIAPKKKSKKLLGFGRPNSVRKKEKNQPDDISLYNETSSDDD